MEFSRHVESCYTFHSPRHPFFKFHKKKIHRSITIRSRYKWSYRRRRHATRRMYSLMWMRVPPELLALFDSCTGNVGYDYCCLLHPPALRRNYAFESKCNRGIYSNSWNVTPTNCIVLENAVRVNNLNSNCTIRRGKSSVNNDRCIIWFDFLQFSRF